jgi:hypothetical protein
MNDDGVPRDNWIDICGGGTIKYDDGREVVIETHSERVWVEVWSNGAIIETLCYSEPQEGSVNSDRIHLIITDGNGERTGWLMNIEDAIAIIGGLSRAVSRAIDLGVPAKE